MTYYVSTTTGALDVLPSVARSAGSYISDYMPGSMQGAAVLVLVNVTEVSGKPDLTIQVQSSLDGSTWTDVASAVAKRGAVDSFVLNHKFVKVGGQSGEDVRVVATVGGSSTPTVTFDVSILAFG